MKQKLVMFGLGWIAVVWVASIWACYTTWKHEEQNILGVSRAFFQQIVLTREWNARHGGLYAVVDTSTPPNPYLKHPMRDIPLEDGRLLTMVNPAYMTRQLSELASEYHGVQFHITSLKPVRPENAPYPWERETLEAFESGLQERGEYFTGGYRYMAPLKTNESCLKCHAEQGYKVGDIRGGISITLPSARCSSFLSMSMGYLLVASVGLLLIGFFGKRLHEAYRVLQEQSVRDPLTGIANRRFFMEKVAEEYRRAERERQPIALIMADIDYFKSYNDTYGHMEGDVCLRRIAEAMQTVLKRPADCIARYGGEEFVIMLPDTSLQGAEKIAEALRSAVEELRIANSASRCCDVVTASFGVAVESPVQGSCDRLLREADDALYRAKQRGRNRVETAAKDL